MAYIDKKDLYKLFEESNGIIRLHIADVDILPTADVVEVKHGYWIDKPTGRYCHIGSYCSVCQEKSGIGGIESNRHKPYCPNCGAKMDGTPKERGADNG